MNAADLRVEANATTLAERTVKLGSTVVLMTPPLNEDYWLLRVPLTERQALVLFPKFGVFGIGFQHEEDWNTNLPSSKPAEEIWDHIKYNAGDVAITRDLGLRAIQMLQETLAEMRAR